MSVKVSGLVWDCPLPREEKFLLLAYADHAAHDGSDVYPSKGTISHMTGYGIRSVQTITARMVKEGWLIADGTSELKTLRYRFNLAKLEGAKIAPPAKIAGRKEGAKIAPEHYVTSEDDIFGDADGNPAKPTESRFEVFYRLYPRKTGKGAAARSWKRQNLDAKADAVIPALAAQIRAGVFKTESRYIPHPATWLNAGRWDDEITHENRSSTNGTSNRANGQIGVGLGRYDRAT